MAAQNFEALQRGVARLEPASLGGLSIDNSTRANAITNGQWIRLDQELHAIQQAFLDKNGTQCGFCTPGMILVSKALLDRNPHPTDEEVAEALAGNYCRCTGYEPIIDAVQTVAAQMNGHKGG